MKWGQILADIVAFLMALFKRQERDIQTAKETTDAVIERSTADKAIRDAHDDDIDRRVRRWQRD